MLIQEVTNRAGEAVEFFRNKTDAVRSLRKEYKGLGYHHNERNLDAKDEYIVFLNNLIRRNGGASEDAPAVQNDAPSTDGIDDLL